MTEYHIRPATDDDCAALYAVAAAMGARHERDYFERCLAEQAAGKRQIFVAALPAGMLAGYIQLIFEPRYSLFRRFNIPEFQDLCVIPDCRGRGIGGALVDTCADVAHARGYTDLGLGVGLHAGFGAAQRLYVAKGFVPDGQGIVYDEETIPAGDMRPVDDFLAIKMVKKL